MKPIAPLIAALALALAGLAGSALAQDRPRAAPTETPRYAPEVAQLLGPWSTSVSGAAWTSPSAIPGWDTLHVSPGALSGLLVIYPDGRYVWNSYGGKRGTWRPSGDAEYPIVIDDPQEQRTWKIGANDRKPNAIYIVEGHGYFFYQGTRP